jgi:hypothetical protein
MGHLSSSHLIKQKTVDFMFKHSVMSMKVALGSQLLIRDTLSNPFIAWQLLDHDLLTSLQRLYNIYYENQ